MVERRKNPIDRCPGHVKDKIAHASVRKMIKRIVATKKAK